MTKINPTTSYPAFPIVDPTYGPTPLLEKEQTPPSNNIKPTPLTVVDTPDFLAQAIPERKFLLYPVVPEQGLVMLYAHRGVGKTYTALHMAYAVATGGAVFSWHADTPQPVLYIDGEMPAYTLQERLKAICASAPTPLPKGQLRVVTPDLQGDMLMPNLARPEGQQAIEPFLDGVKLVIIDNIATLCQHGCANDVESWLPTQSWILSLRRRGISVLLVHHANKSGGQRGTSAKEDVLDTVIELRRPRDYKSEQGARFEVHLTKSRCVTGEDVTPFCAQLNIEAGIARWHVAPLNAAMLKKVQELADNGGSLRTIGEALSVDKDTVQRLCKKHGIITRGKR